MLNRVVLVGRLTKDPDLKYTKNGTAVANVTLACKRTFPDQNGNYHTDFINCVVWKNAAENIAQYMKKGNKVGIDGRIQTRTYEDNDGKTVYVTEVVAEMVSFLESKSNQVSNNQNVQQDQQGNNNLHYNPYEGHIPYSSDQGFNDYGYTMDISGHNYRFDQVD